MIIRSQDKKGFVNLENIDTVCMNDEFSIYAFNDKSKSFIGTYSTEEKAIKVLDMIQNAYERYKMFTITYQDGMMQKLEKCHGTGTKACYTSITWKLVTNVDSQDFQN